MFFLQASQSPVLVKLWDGTDVTIQKFTIDDCIQWGAEIRDQRILVATKGMSEGVRREFLTFYPPVPPDLNEIRRMVRTAEGSKYIVGKCLSRCKLPADTLQKILGGSTAQLSKLAWELADIDESVVMTAPKEVDQDRDPLK